MRNLKEFHELVWHNQAPILLRYLPDEVTEADEYDLMMTRFYPDDLGTQSFMNVRIDNLLMSGIEAIRDHYDLSKSDCVRTLIRLGIAQLEGEFINPADQESLSLEKTGGVGGSAPYGSTDGQSDSPANWTNPRKLGSSSKHPHGHQNRKAS